MGDSVLWESGPRAPKVMRALGATLLVVSGSLLIAATAFNGSRLDLYVIEAVPLLFLFGLGVQWLRRQRARLTPEELVPSKRPLRMILSSRAFAIPLSQIRGSEVFRSRGIVSHVSFVTTEGRRHDLAGWDTGVEGLRKLVRMVDSGEVAKLLAPSRRFEEQRKDRVNP